MPEDYGLISQVEPEVIRIPRITQKANLCVSTMTL